MSGSRTSRSLTRRAYGYAGGKPALGGSASADSVDSGLSHDITSVKVPMDVAAVAFNGTLGQNTTELVFIDGLVFDVSGDDGSIDNTTASVLRVQQSAGKISGLPSGYAPYYRVIGNLTPLTHVSENFGHEAVAFTVCVAYRNPSNASAPLLYGFFGCDTYPVFTENAITAYAHSSNKPDNYFSGAGEFNFGKEACNVVMCEVYYGDSGYKARFSSKEYIYTNPSMLAVLQAAPFFGELGKDPGATTYSISRSFSFSDGLP